MEDVAIFKAHLVVFRLVVVEVRLDEERVASATRGHQFLVICGQINKGEHYKMEKLLNIVRYIEPISK